MKRRHEDTSLPAKGVFAPASPLWKIAPVHDAQGVLVADFMLLIPRLRQRGPAFAEHAAQTLLGVCESFGEQVQFADLNVRTGAIWVSVEARPGLCKEVASAIRRVLPEAVTVGGQLGAGGAGLLANDSRGAALQRLVMLVSRIPRRVVRRLLPSLPDSADR